MIDWLNEAWAWFRLEYADNDFLVGTTIPFVLGGLAYMFRNIFRSIWAWLKRATTSQIVINTDNEYYQEICSFLYNDCISPFFQKRYMLSYVGHKNRNEARYEDIEDDGKKIKTTLGYGKSFGWINGLPVMINREKEESDSGSFKEITTIVGFGPKKKIFEKINSEVGKISNSEKDSNFIRIKTFNSWDWNNAGFQPKRKMDSIILPKDQKDYLISKLDEFLTSEDYYIEKGIPYHLGIILSGPAGTGKSSLVNAIASYLNRTIAINTEAKLKLDNIDVHKDILVLEDIDASGLAVGERKNNSSQDGGDGKMVTSSMSEILNILDGVLSPHGMITIATTNHFDKLDPAITRPGRFDVHLELGLMQWKEWNELFAFLDRNPPFEDESLYEPIPASRARYMATYYSDEDIKDFFNKKVECSEIKDQKNIK